MKIIGRTFTLLLLFTCVVLQAQVQEITKHAEFVLEGDVISTEAKWNETRSHIITENRVKVKSVFKGEFRDSIITIQTFGGIVDDDFHYKTHEINLSKGSKGYFFLDFSYDTKQYSFSDQNHGFAKAIDKRGRYILTSSKVYKSSEFEEEIIKQTKFPKLSFQQNFDISSIQALGDRDTCDLLPLTRNTKTIEFTFDNVSYSPDFKYLEFDVMAQVNTAGLKFGKGNLFIRYDKSIGENLVNKGNIEITKGEILNNSVYNFSYSDFSENSIFVNADSQFGSNQMFTFTTVPSQLVHVKVAIEDVTQFGTFSFDDIDITGSVYYWCQGQYNLFDQVTLDEPINAVNSLTPIGLTYTFENLNVNQGNTELEVELFAEARGSTQYSDAFIYINYNELGFGSNVVSNSTFSFVQEDLLDDPNVYDIFLSDEDPNTLLLLVFSNDENSLSTLGTTPRKLGTLTFQIQDCEEEKDLHFDPITESSDHTHYTGATPIPYELYDPVIADDEETGKICGCSKPIITSFSPTTIHAGTGEILTITGQNFGNWNQLESTVLFPNGDDGGLSMMEAGMKDFEWDNVVHWSDTEIQIKVPSTDKEQGADNPACTGKFQVKNECDISDKSDDDLLIPYAILNSRNGTSSPAFKIGIEENSNPGICFQFTDDTPGWIIDQFEIALNSWCNQTGINFSIGSSVPSSTQLDHTDDINVIKYGGQNSNVGGGMAIQGQYYNSICNSSEVGWYFDQIDFILYSGFGDPASQEQQLREIIRHELGHSHMLAHARNNTSLDQPLMHYEGNFNGIITNADATGANLVFANSQAIVSSCGTPIGNGNCGGSCSTNSVNDLSNDFQVKVSPNPNHGFVELSIQEENLLAIDFIEIYNTNGTLVNRLTIGRKVETISLELPSYSGTYILKILSGNKSSSSKVIRL